MNKTSNISEALSILDKALEENKDEIRQLLGEKYKYLHDTLFDTLASKIPPSSKRVPLNTDQQVQKRIWLETVENITAYVNADKKKINRRVRELDEEWDVERILESNASALALLGILLSSHNRRWLLLSFGVASFLLQHAVQGWCPALPFIRRLGIRTQREIVQERNVLKRLRGDFGKINQTGTDPRKLAIELLEKELT